MPKFRKIPVVIDAVQIPEWMHTNNKSLSKHQEELGAIIIRVPVNQTREQYLEGRKSGTLIIWLGESRLRHPHEEPSYKVEGATILSLEGVHDTNAGDWIITGVVGERYFCRNDIFQKTYEAA